MAVATAGLYLAGNIGTVLGVSISSSVQKGMLKALLTERLRTPEGKRVIARVLSDVAYVGRLEGELRETVVESYVESLEYSHGTSFLMPTESCRLQALYPLLHSGSSYPYTCLATEADAHTP
jgi:hypothetical protein